MKSPDRSAPRHLSVLIVPYRRIQNANAISSPLTWGFPAMTAFTGLMTALERRLGRDAGIALHGVGVICHTFEAQVTSGGYTRAFYLTRNPVLADGSTAGIVEEGRAHLEVTLVFDAEVSDEHRGDAERASLAQRVGDTLAGMRIAGGSVMPTLPAAPRHRVTPSLELVPDDDDEQRKQFRRFARHWLPGFALVSRDDLLQARVAELRAQDSNASLLDAWLDLSRWNSRAVRSSRETANDAQSDVEWATDRRTGWTVPIPVGFTALSELHDPGTVRGTRDTHTPFRFVETIWSIGQWVSPHRLKRLRDLFWVPDFRGAPGQPDNHASYRCVNGYGLVSPEANLHV
jgi:CRISPR-associated protein Csy2